VTDLSSSSQVSGRSAEWRGAVVEAGAPGRRRDTPFGLHMQ
jgi:hypothetical protein